MPFRLALIGGRGYTGSSLLPLIAGHRDIDLVLATSGSMAGRPLTDVHAAWPDPGQRLESCSPSDCEGIAADIWVLALPNGASAPWVEAIAAAHSAAIIVDLGADYRFDPEWVYGLSEWNRQALSGARRIANPGCYATGAQFGLLPLRDWLVRPPVVFGVSGYSGAGKTPSPRNDPERLRDNLIPYSLTGHVHEREISTRLGRPVRFYPHVASFFRGISLTLSVDLAEPISAEALAEHYEAVYADEPLIRTDRAIPEISMVSGTPNLIVGGFSVDPRSPHRASLVVVLDNLLKGAASQAVQNINLALGLDERLGLTPDDTVRSAGPGSSS